MKTFKTVSELQHHLKDSIQESIENELFEICTKIVEKHLMKDVYDNPNAGYIPRAEEGSPFKYERTWELFNSLTISDVKMGSKYATFEIYMNGDAIESHKTGEGEWNQHADIDYEEDVSEYIPMWIEDGTNGSLWDFRPTQYMFNSWKELRDDGILRDALEQALRSRGWKITKPKNG